MEAILTRTIFSLLALSALATAGSAAAQTSTAAAPTGETPPVTVTTVDPVMPPATVVTPIAPGTVAVTQVPGVAATSTMKIQSFADYDIDDNGAYSPMEFAQAMAFLSAANPAAGGMSLPAKDKFSHKGMIGKMSPKQATAILNATSDEFAAIDMNKDWRITPEELTAAAMM